MSFMGTYCRKIGTKRQLSSPDFPVYRIRLRYQVEQSGNLPWNPGAIIRGTLGKAMHDLFCLNRGVRCQSCAFTHRCVYFSFFSRTHRSRNGFYSNLNKFPRLYIIEAPLNRSRLERGDSFEFYLLLIGHAIERFSYWIRSALYAGELGFGHERIKMRLREVSEANPFSQPGKSLVSINNRFEVQDAPSPLRCEDFVQKSQEFLHTRHVKITFLTHTRLLEKGSPVEELRFYLLLQSILRRLNMLSEISEVGTQWSPDFSKYSQIADMIGVYSDQTFWKSRIRWSASQQKEIDIGGFLGSIIFFGSCLQEVLPFLEFARLVHIGKGTVYGNGRFDIDVK